MNSEKVKEIKKGLEEYIRQYSNFKGAELCKEALTLINELESEKAETEYWRNRCKEISDIERKETAEKCINIIEERYKKCRLSIDCWITSFAETEAAKKVIKVFFDNTKKELAKQFGVEIKEN